VTSNCCIALIRNRTRDPTYRNQMNPSAVMEYGAVGGRDVIFSEKSSLSRGQVFLHGQRNRLNVYGILMSLFAPWLLFLFVYAVLSFRIHYGQPEICYLLVALAFFFGVAVPGVLAANQTKKKLTDAHYIPSWNIYLVLTCFVAFCVGSFTGQYNYAHFMQPYYDYLNLAKYTDLDTNQFVGQQLMDAGRIDFRAGTSLDLIHSMGFKNTEMYCVVPIVTKDSPYKAQSHDFWAVGKNCCSGTQADFHCLGFSDPLSTGALRIINPWDRPFYNLAVQQAEATYKITASHPLFFEWVRNADTEMDSFKQKGITTFIMWICASLLFQGTITTIAFLSFSKLVHQ